MCLCVCVCWLAGLVCQCLIYSFQSANISLLMIYKILRDVFFKKTIFIIISGDHD